MSATTYRQVCGTHLGLVAHQAADESPCGTCRQGEFERRVSVEAWPIALWPAPVPPISREQAEHNLAALMEAMADEAAADLDHPGPPDPIEEAK